MTLQEMHEAVCVKRNIIHATFRLTRSTEGQWRAAWSHCPMARSDVAQAAIDEAFRLAMEDR